MNEMIRDRIMALRDEEYRKFSAALLPNINNLLGVRLPELRRLAREIARADWRTYLANPAGEYFEELMLQGMVIGYLRTDIEEILGCIARFVSQIDNWAVCDSFCAGLKFTRQYPEPVWNFLQPYLWSEDEYEVRFGVVMLLDYFINEEYIDRVLQVLDHAGNEGYYARMAVAWALSVCYVKLPDRTLTFLKNNALDDFTHNKTLQKIMESRRVDRESKELIRSLKRK